jgi:EpsI family protein
MDDKLNMKTLWSLIASLLILGLTAIYLTLFKPAPVPLKQPLSTFPLHLGEWSGKELNPDQSLLKEVKTSDRLDRLYQDQNEEKITLTIRYFPIQSGEQKIVGYLTDGLHEEARVIYLPTSRGGGEVNAVTAINRKDGGRSIIYFWYDIDNNMVTNRYKAKLRSFWGAALQRKTNGAIVVISTNQQRPFTGDEEKFIEKAIPVIRDFLKTD